MLTFLLLVLGTGGYVEGSVLKSPDDAHLVFQWVVRVEEQVLVCVCGFAVNTYTQGSVFFDANFAVEKRQGIVLDVFPGELDVIVHRVDVFCEWLHLVGFDLHPSVIHIAKPKAGLTPWNESSALRSTSSMYRLATIGDTGEPMAQPCFCL